MKNVRLGIFISGGGSNAKKLVQYFDGHQTIEVAKIISNNSRTPLLTDETTKDLVECLSSDEMMHNEAFFSRCKKDFDYIILAGYLKLIPEQLIASFENKIINLHPAILPNYGGKGMYGMNVHRAIFEKKEKFSGITIHFVNKEYDKGSYIAQCYTDIQQCQSPEEIQKAVQVLEHTYFPVVIEKTILNS